MLAFTGVCFDVIVRPDRVTSEIAETSVTESPENKGIRVERYSHKYSSVAKIHHYHWSHKYSFVTKIHHYLRCTSWLQNPTCLVMEYCFILFIHPLRDIFG